MKLDYSIIVCTYNPDERILQRCLNSLLHQNLDQINAEIIIVDNNSSFPVKDLNCLKYLHDSRVRVISEPNPGLTNARIAGVRNSQASVIVFADDDNELERNYLQGLKTLMNKYPFVGIWGAGIINVDFIDGAESWIKQYMLSNYQQKNVAFTQFGCVAGWSSYYPVGSGMVVKKSVFEEYIALFENGELTAMDRTGNSLTSAGDGQIIWTAVKKGVPAGTSPLLKLTHIIPLKRTSFKYLMDLNYNISLSYYKGLQEMFPETIEPFRKTSIFNKLILLIKTFIKTRANIFVSYKLYNITLAWHKGFEQAHING